MASATRTLRPRRSSPIKSRKGSPGRSGCPTCPCNARAIVPRASVKSDMAIVLDQPTEIEVARSTWLSSKRGGGSQLLAQSLAAMGVNIEELYICSALNCRPNSTKAAMQKKAMLSCRDRLLEELRAAGVKKVLCVGPIGFSAIAGDDRLLPITKHRGRWRRSRGFDVIATLPMNMVISDAMWFRDFAFDLDKFINTDGLQPTPDVEMWVVKNRSELADAMDLMEEYPFVGCDFETTGFSPIDDYPLSFGVCGIDGTDGTDGQVIVFDQDMLETKFAWQAIGKLLSSSQEVVWHNAKFDLQHAKQGLLDRGLKYKPREIHDTMMLHYTLDERPISAKYRSHGLEALARVRYDAPDYGIQIGKFLQEWETVGPGQREDMRKALHTYMSLDCYYTTRLYPDLWNEALEEDEELIDLYTRILMPATLAIADIEHHGILIDKPMFESMNEELSGRAKEVLAKLQKRKDTPPDFNPGSPKQVEDYLYNTLKLPFGIREENGKVYHSTRRGGLQEGPTAAPVIKSLGERFPEHLEVIDQILEYRTFTKTIGTYVKGMLDRCDGDGRIRTSFNLAGTSTGRLSSSNPNLQNVPDASHIGYDIRAGFVAAPGNVFVEADYKQLEVRIAAELCGDPVMYEVFQSGRDPHQEIAYSIYHKEKSKITKYERWLAKNILFGLLYGRGYESVAMGPEQEDIARHGGKRWSIEEVKSYYDSLLATWERFAEWQQEQKVLGYATGLIKTRTGRRRRFDFIPKHDGGFIGRAAFNSPIQGLAADFTTWAMIRLHATLPEGAHIVLTIHDELVIECRREQAEEVAELMRYTMEEDTLYETNVPLKVDVDFSDRWGGKSSVDRDVIAVEETE